MVTLKNFSWFWVADLTCTHVGFLRGMRCFSDVSRQLILEGTSKEVERRLNSVSEVPLIAMKSGNFQFRKPRLIGVQLTLENIQSLLGLGAEYAGPEMFIHCHLVTSSEVLMEAYDVGANIVCFSPLLPSEQIHTFSKLMNVKFERQKC